MKRLLAGVLALAVTTLSVSLTHAADAYASLPVSPADVAKARAVAPDDPMVRDHPDLVTRLKSWTVQDGQTLSSIAGAKYGDQNAWTLIYYANRSHVKWANQIKVGQVLTLPTWAGTIPAPPRLLSPPPPRPRVVFHRAYVRSGSSTYSSTGTRRTYHRSYTPSGTYSGSGSMERCIIRAESGGNSQVMNSSGHYGLYQFSYSTWVGSGGSGGSFGHASVAEQQRVFHTAVAARGYSDWTPYDGC